jgi:hypothetical protein
VVLETSELRKGTLLEQNRCLRNKIERIEEKKHAEKDNFWNRKS